MAIHGRIEVVTILPIPYDAAYIHVIRKYVVLVQGAGWHACRCGQGRQTDLDGYSHHTRVMAHNQVLGYHKTS